jgi:uncharacterized RDD family membrane protein YckC
MAEEWSPYTPPASLVLDPDEQLSAHPDAGLGRRFVNNVLDSVGVQALAVPVGIVMGIVFPDALDLLDDVVPSLLFGLGLFFLYYAGFEYTLGLTPGKLATGTRIVRVDGGNLSFACILGRTAARMVPFEPFSFFGVASPRGWHDTWSGTRVVNTRGS